MKKCVLLFFALSGCIGEDIVFDEVEPVIRITNPIISLEIGNTYQLQFMMTNDIGMSVTPENTSWTSSDESIAQIDAEGVVSGIDYGVVTITLTANYGIFEVTTTLDIDISDDTIVIDGVRFGTVSTTSSYTLRGDFELKQEGENIVLSLASNYVADTRLPGLYLYLTNNPNSPSGGHELGAVQIFTGAHSYVISGVGLYDFDYVFYYCKPFHVKVGHGQIMNP